MFKRGRKFIQEVRSKLSYASNVNKWRPYIKSWKILWNIDQCFRISSSKGYQWPYDKRDDFDFHIINFPFLSSNIPSGPSYGVYISQLIKYARCCSYYDDFRYCHKCLVERLFSQAKTALWLEVSFKKIYGEYEDLIEKYPRSVKEMVNHLFPW